MDNRCIPTLNHWVYVKLLRGLGWGAYIRGVHISGIETKTFLKFIKSRVKLHVKSDAKKVNLLVTHPRWYPSTLFHSPEIRIKIISYLKYCKNADGMKFCQV